MMAIYNDTDLVLVLRINTATAYVRKQNGAELTVPLTMLEFEPSDD